eukprot:4586762-Alexandrium_andersonii.AAC.1
MPARDPGAASRARRKESRAARGAAGPKWAKSRPWSEAGKGTPYGECQTGQGGETLTGALSQNGYGKF